MSTCQHRQSREWCAGRTWPVHVRLGRQGAYRELGVKGGEATCEALDSQGPVCYGLWSPNAHILVHGARPLLRTGRALMLTFSRPIGTPQRSHFGAPFRIITAKRAACEWTGTNGNSRRRRSQCGNGGSACPPGQRSACCLRTRYSTGRTPGWR